MSEITETKAQVIDEVLAINDLLKEYHRKISQLPRSVTAARQLKVIITRLDGWHQAFSLSQHQPEPAPPKEEIMREAMVLLENFLEKRLAA